MGTDFGGAHWMTAKLDSKCHDCGEDICTGDKIVWAPNIRKVYCKGCGENIIPAEEPLQSFNEVRETLRQRSKSAATIKNKVRSK